MFAVALIVLRETLEASLIVSIVLAASIGVPNRGRWVAAGVGGGILGSLLVALSAGVIAESFAGSGQELLNAAILGLAVCMLAWHNIWMASHARDLTRQANALGQAVATGGRPMIALALITGAAVLREGSETVLFLFGVAAASSEGMGALLTGGALGLLGGMILGGTLYFGLLRIPLKRLFAVMGVLVLFLAAGLAAQSVTFLVQADLLPSLGEGWWDTSAWLAEDGIPGKILHTLIGYVARPSGMQLLAWGLTIALIALPMWLIANRRPAGRGPAGNVMAMLAALTAGLLGFGQPAWADMHVRLPHVNWREFEFEHNGSITFGAKGSAVDRAQSYTNAISYGVTPWWKIELEGELASGGGQHLTWAATTLENTFQLTERGQYWLDLGFFAEYSQATGSVPNALQLGPILHKEGPSLFGYVTAHTLNVFFSRDVGGGATHRTGLNLAWQSVLRIDPLIAPGFEYYSGIEDTAQFGRFREQRHFLGPVLTGAQNFAPWGKLKYEVGYLFGLTSAPARSAVRWKLEYEIVF